MGRNNTQLAGWLFADLLLALVIVFIGSEVRHHRTDIALPNQSKTATPSPSATRKEVGRLENKPRDSSPIQANVLAIANGSASEFASFKSLFSKEPLLAKLDRDARYASVVEVFSWTPASDLGPGNSSSERICGWLKKRGGLTNARTVCQAYIKTSLKKDKVFVRLFLVAK